MKYDDFIVKSLGKSSVVSPLISTQTSDSPVYKFVDEKDRILYDVSTEDFLRCSGSGEVPISFEKAGPKEDIFFVKKEK